MGLMEQMLARRSTELTTRREIEPWRRRVVDARLVDQPQLPGNGVLARALETPTADAAADEVASAGYGMAGRMEEMGSLPVLAEKAPKMGLARRAMRGVGKVAGAVRKHPYLTLGALAGAQFAGELGVSAVTGLREGFQSADERQRLQIAEAEFQKKPWRQLLAEQEVADLVQRRLSLLQGEPALYNYVRGLPAMTAHEFLIGGKPDNQKAIDFVLLDAMKDGSVDEVMAQKSSADASVPATGLSGLAM